MPCHYTLESGLHLYIEALRTTALQAGAPLDPKSYIFSNARSPADRRTAPHTAYASPVYRMTPAAPPTSASTPESAATAFEPPGSPNICTTVANTRSPNR